MFISSSMTTPGGPCSASTSRSASLCTSKPDRPSRTLSGKGTMASTRWPSLMGGAGALAAGDRKSTRLNSSHSLHDALSICFSLHVQAGSAFTHFVRKRHDGFDAMAFAYGRRRRTRGRRSEEHTSELQSLPTRRSFDLLLSARPSRIGLHALCPEKARWLRRDGLRLWAAPAHSRPAVGNRSCGFPGPDETNRGACRCLPMVRASGSRLV